MKKKWGHFSKGISFANFLGEKGDDRCDPFGFNLLQKKKKLVPQLDLFG
jgi:hypothetical protein